MEKSLVLNLQNPKLYNFPIKKFKVVETHISWVLLTGRYAFKIKKPIKFFDFVDFSSLQKRHFYCKEELRLNKILAGTLYLDVVPIFGSKENPSLTRKNLKRNRSKEKNKHVLEYALKMQEFDQNYLFSKFIIKPQFPKAVLTPLALKMANFHSKAKKAARNSLYGSLESIEKNMNDNFNNCRSILHQKNLLARLETIESWSKKTFEHNKANFRKRKKDFVRDCHGDFHLNNVVLFKGEPLVFDRIDFNPNFRFIDVIDEISFFCMDLESRKLDYLSYLFLNQYLSITGDYSGLQLFKFYQVYRAMVRAKIALLMKKVPGQKELEGFKFYLDFAEQIISPQKVYMIITFGVSGSGKSFVAKELSALFPAIHINSDVERKRLHKGGKKKLYSKATTEKTYQQLLKLSQEILQSGFSVIVDATFLNKDFRDRFGLAAKKLNVQMIILDFKNPQHIIKRRVNKRALNKKDVSDADVKVLEQQLEYYQPLTTAEKKNAIIVKSGKVNELKKIKKKILI